MAPRYDLSADLVATDGLQSTAPGLVVGFARYANPVTWDPAARSATTSDIEFARAERKPIVTTECVSASFNSTKSSYRQSMSLTFLETGTTAFLNEVLPGDWVIANMTYDDTATASVFSRMTKGDAVNKWDDGLKFVGRVKSVTKGLSVSRDGVVNSQYQVQCEAFSEFDSVVMYYPQLARGESIPESMTRFGVEVGKVIRAKYGNDRGALDINLIIPRLMRVIFGEGAWAGQRFREEALTPNSAYVVPRHVFRWLGLDDRFSTFADLVRIMMGVQKYRQAANTTNATAVSPGAIFWPDGATLKDGVYGPSDLYGSFPQNVVPQTTSSAWGFLTTYLNPPINEPLVGLRPDEEGNVFPFFTIRQAPYTSEIGLSYDERLAAYEVDGDVDAFDPSRAFSRNVDTQYIGPVPAEPVAPRKPTLPPPLTRPTWAAKMKTTRFLELPRWVVPTSILKSASIGRSDDNRYNLVFVFGSGPGAPFSEADQFVRAGPLTDKLDIARHGIRPYMPSVNVFTRDTTLFTQDWRDLMADIVMGQHLTLSGSLTVSGIRSPVAPGDNLEFEGVVYHIESVSHTYSFDPSSGMRDFVTTFSLSRGVKDVLGGQSTPRSERFANLKATDPEGPSTAVNKD